MSQALEKNGHDTELSYLQKTTLLVAFATLAFALVTGGLIIWPTNVAWLQRADLTIHYLGWLFFKNSPWSWPPGANPGYGLELSSSIVYSDSIPLFAFIFKSISNYLPESFQYFGIWSLSCFILQTFMAWKLVGLITKHPWGRFLATSLFLFAPPFLWRFRGHYSLGGQWLILSALFLNLTPRKNLPKEFLWPFLLSIATLVHAYIFVMVGALWFSDLGKRLMCRDIKIKPLMVECLLAVVTVTVCLWSAGYFVIEEMRKSTGFGFYRMNLLSLFDSDGWSYFLPDLPGKEGDYEGFNFLGAGSILILFTALTKISIIRSYFKNIYRWLPLLFVLLLLTLLSFSNNIGVGTYDIFTFTVPDNMSYFSSTFRSSGRMFWPVYYSLIWAALWLVIQKSTPRFHITVLVVAFILQIFDTSAGWLPIRHKKLLKTGKAWQSTLQSAFWQEIPLKYKKIRIMPVGYNKPNSRHLAYFAAKNSMQTDAAQSARATVTGLRLAVNQAKETINTGNYANDSVYIMNDQSAALAKKSYNSKNDLFIKVDGFNVLAPGWYGGKLHNSTHKKD